MTLFIIQNPCLVTCLTFSLGLDANLVRKGLLGGPGTKEEVLVVVCFTCLTFSLGLDANLVRKGLLGGPGTGGGVGGGMLHLSYLFVQT